MGLSLLPCPAHPQPRDHVAAVVVPDFIPALLAMVRATSAILTGEESISFWIALLVAYDVVFTMASLFLFETVLQAE